MSTAWTLLAAFLGGLSGAILTAVAQMVVTKWKLRTQFRLAALDKRLAAHQEAYRRCAELMANIYDESRRVPHLVVHHS